MGANTEEAYAGTELDFGHGHGPIDEHVSQKLSKFLPSHVKKKKIDLSSVNTIQWEDNLAKLEASGTLAFRSSTPLRKLLMDYLHKVEPLFRNPSVTWDSAGVEGVLAESLQNTFEKSSLETLDATGFDVADVASWSWILSSDTIDLAVRRYTLLAEDLRNSRRPAIPKFVLLQVLRADHVSHFALQELIKSILTDLRMSQDTKHYGGWGWVTRVCLVVRLLRHARRVAPESLEDVSSIVGHLFSDYYGVGRLLERPELHRLTHIFNRFLTLIALTPAKTPFNAYHQQQNAQLALVRLMVAFEPQLPITREGYRALITVQLLHRKTSHERTWAEAKSPSWPPWRHIRSGIEQDLEYPGKESRVMKLLGRMNEAGYTHGEWEKSAAVLAGWDTDKSPTIQTRAILTRPTRPWTISAHSDGAAEGPTLWAARIRATRSRREAWASFCAYEKSTDPSRVRYQPYFAMLEKLLVQTVTPDSQVGSAYIAGDVKEVFEDSSNPRDLIYIDKDVPSADEFYQYMLRKGIRPGGSLLSGLLRSAPNISTGFTYIRDSRWDDMTKRVIGNAEDYSPTIIRQTLSAVPDQTLAALIELLSRHGFDDEQGFRSSGEGIFAGGKNPSSKNPSSKKTVSPFVYAWELLNAARSSDPRLWNALLKGCLHCLSEARALAMQENVDPSSIRDLKYDMWARLWMTFAAASRPWYVHPDLESFRYAARIISVMLRDRRVHVTTARYGWFAKAIFLHAVYGRRITPFLPPASAPLLVVPDIGDLQLLVRVLVSIHDVEGLMALVRWLNGHAETYKSLNSYPESHSDPHRGLPPLRNILSSIRLFLEGSSARPFDGHGLVSFETPLSVSPEAVAVARVHCELLGWPSDAEIGVFLSREADWLERVARDADVAASKRARREKIETIHPKGQEREWDESEELNDSSVVHDKQSE